MRNEIVDFANKKINVKELKIIELKNLGTKLGVEIENLDKVEANNIVDYAVGLLSGKLPEIFDGISDDDVLNAYPSEIEALIEAFIKVNFFGLRKAFSGFLPLIQKYL